MNLEIIKDLGLQLPEISNPGGNYVSVNIRGKIAYIAIQFPIIDGEFLYTGTIGKEIDTESAYKAF